MAKLAEITATDVFSALHEAFNYNYKIEDAQRKYVLEGSSGSSKTTSIIQVLILYCQANKWKGKRITAGRAKYSWTKDSILKDFIRILIETGIYDVKDHKQSHPQKYNLWGNMISFVGLDDPQRFQGPRQDITWINEAMEADYDSYTQLAIRTNEGIILDFNPSFTIHWIFSKILLKKETKPEVFYNHSTFRDNKWLPRGQVDQILALNPFHPDDANLPYDERRPHPTNIDNGTADRHKWMVYGEGKRAVLEGLIYPYVNYVKNFPANISYWYGLDFGFTCFDGDTLIETINGQVPIRDINKGDLVLTRSGYKRVLRKFNNGNKEVIEKEISTNLGMAKILATFKHNFSVNNGWKQYGQLEEDDNLYVLSSSMGGNTKRLKYAVKNVQVSYLPITNVKTSEKKIIREVYDLEIEDVHEYFANGILVHNCDPTALVKMAIDGRDLYLQKKLYEPIPSPELLSDALQNAGVRRIDPIGCDSADKYDGLSFSSDLQEMGWNIERVRKTKNRVYWTEQIKMYRINIVGQPDANTGEPTNIDNDFQIEQENYRWKMINKMATNTPIDGYDHCFIGDTLITTSNGDVPIIAMAKGMFVTTRNGERKVLRFNDNGEKRVFDYILKTAIGDIKISATPDHKIKTKNKWTKLKLVTKTDRVYLAKSSWGKNIISIMESVISRKQTRDYTVLYGNTLMEEYPTDLISTIRIVIRIIMTLAISKWSICRFIVASIQKTGCRIKKRLINSNKQGLKQQRSGINLMTVKGGTQNMPSKWDLDTLIMVNEFAMSVISRSSQKQKSKDFAQRNAGRSIVGIITSMILIKTAKSVVKYLHQINMTKQDFVVECALLDIKQENERVEHVYDLTVAQDHEYFANGLLVHNCWDATKYGIILSKEDSGAFW